MWAVVITTDWSPLSCPLFSQEHTFSSGIGTSYCWANVGSHPRLSNWPKGKQMTQQDQFQFSLGSACGGWDRIPSQELLMRRQNVEQWGHLFPVTQRKALNRTEWGQHKGEQSRDWERERQRAEETERKMHTDNTVWGTFYCVPEVTITSEPIN